MTSFFDYYRYHQFQLDGKKHPVLYACNVSVFKIDLILMLVWSEMKTTDYDLSWSAMCVPQ